jgi:drug/metabolite transporter (DMT)-like permease
MESDARIAAARQAIGILLALGSTVAFAIGPTAARLALDNGCDVLTVITLRGVIGAAMMVPPILLSRRGFAIERHAVRWCAYAGLFYAVMIYGFIGAVAAVPVSVAVLVFFTHPILIAAIVHWQGGERLTRRKLVLAVAVLAGLGLAVGPEVQNLDLGGVALAALAAVAISGMILSSARAQAHATTTQVNFAVTALSSIVFAGLTTAAGAWALPANAIGWIGVAAAGLGIGLGFLSFFAAFRYVSPVRATMLTNVEPLLSILFAALILGERLDPSRWAGVGLVIGALVLFEAAGRGRRDDPQSPSI